MYKGLVGAYVILKKKKAFCRIDPSQHICRKLPPDTSGHFKTRTAKSSPVSLF